MFDIGSALGGPIIGCLTDRYASKAQVLISAASLICTATLALLGSLAASPLVCLLVLGICNAGPDTFLGGPIANQLGEKGGRHSAVGVTSLINGASGLGSVFEGPLLGKISEDMGGFEAVIVAMALASGLSAVTALMAHKRV